MIKPEILKQARINAKLTQAQVAEQLSITRQSVSKWESGQSYPDIDNLIELSKVYNVSLDTLLGIENNQTTESNALFSKIEKDESLLLIILSASMSIIPIVQIFFPFYILKRNQKGNSLYRWIIIINCFIIIFGLYTLYTLITTFYPFNTEIHQFK